MKILFCVRIMMRDPPWQCIRAEAVIDGALTEIIFFARHFYGWTMMAFIQSVQEGALSVQSSFVDGNSTSFKFLFIFIKFIVNFIIPSHHNLLPSF